MKATNVLQLNAALLALGGLHAFFMGGLHFEPRAPGVGTLEAKFLGHVMGANNLALAASVYGASSNPTDRNIGTMIMYWVLFFVNHVGCNLSGAYDSWRLHPQFFYYKPMIALIMIFLLSQCEATKPTVNPKLKNADGTFFRAVAGLMLVNVVTNGIESILVK